MFWGGCRASAVVINARERRRTRVQRRLGCRRSVLRRSRGHFPHRGELDWHVTPRRSRAL